MENEVKLPKHIYLSKKRYGRLLKTPEYRVEFDYKTISYSCGSYPTLTLAKRALDIQRIKLGLEPVHLKRIVKS